MKSRYQPLRCLTCAALAGLLTSGIVMGLISLGSTAREYGLDFWTVPQVLNEAADSQHRVEKEEEARRELAEVVGRREGVLRAVLESRITVAEGLRQFQTIYEDAPLLWGHLQAYCHHLPPDQILPAQYRAHLEEAFRTDPARLVWLRPQLDALVAHMVRPKSGDGT